jgi:hypothetical protein
VTYVNDQISPTMFKKVPGGYVFPARGPWLLGATPRYLVTEAQKAELVDILTPVRPFQRRAVLVIVPTLWLLLLVFVGNNSAIGAFILASPMIGIALWSVLMVGTMVLALHLENRPMQRRLQPVLASLPRTDERITSREWRDAIDKTTSAKQSLFAGVGLTLMCLGLTNSLLRSQTHDGLYYLLAAALIVLAASAAVAFARALRKAREGSR